MSSNDSSTLGTGDLASTLVELLRQQQKQSEAQQAILMGMLEQQTWQMIMYYLGYPVGKGR